MARSQIVGKQSISPLKGILIVLVCLVLMFTASILFNALYALGVSTLVSSIGFWLTGGGIAAFVFHRYVITYVYTLDGVKLVIERIFSRKPRFMQQILLREIVYIGEWAQVKEKYKDASKQRAIRKQCAYPETAVVYRRAGETHVMILQPEPEFLEALKSSIKK